MCAVTSGSGDSSACCSCQGWGQALGAGSSSDKLLLDILHHIWVFTGYCAWVHGSLAVLGADAHWCESCCGFGRQPRGFHGAGGILAEHWQGTLLGSSRRLLCADPTLLRDPLKPAVVLRKHCSRKAQCQDSSDSSAATPGSYTGTWVLTGTRNNLRSHLCVCLK